ncbi:MAG: hypothetical protein HKM02_10640 [Pseudomonadales bacterium]|nr:hypothetical protein [Pseudomonadales bacterium]
MKKAKAKHHEQGKDLSAYKFILTKKYTPEQMAQLQALVTEANCYYEDEDWERAELAYRTLLPEMMANPVLWHNLFIALMQQEKFEELPEILHKLTLLDNFLASNLWVHWGAWYEFHREDELAVSCFKKAMALDPDNGNALRNLSVIAQRRGDSADALSYMERALSLENNLCWRLEKFKMTIPSGQLDLVEYEAIQALPESFEVCRMRSAINAGLFRGQEFFKDAQCAVRLLPKDTKKYAGVWGDYYQAMSMVLSWEPWEEVVGTILKKLDDGFWPCIPGTSLLSLPVGASRELQVAIKYVCKEAREIKRSQLAVPAGERISLAYVSADFGAHPISYLTAGLFAAHDRTRFEVFAISTGHRSESAIQARIRDGVEHYVDARHWSNQQLVDFAREQGIHIAIDLNGHTSGHRLGAFMQRLAPVQINYLGYPGTLGTPEHDYILADPIVLPPDLLVFFSEKAAYLPYCFQVNDDQRRAAPSLSRQAYGLPEQAVVLACFCSVYKMNPLVFAQWCIILRHCPNSVLWLAVFDVQAQENLWRWAEEREGIPRQRIIMANNSLAYEEHLARYRVCDLVLDTLPFGGGTTTSDALWMGAPVLTCVGDTFAGRMSASLLHALACQELICDSMQDYVSRAITWVSNPEGLRQWRTRLLSTPERDKVFSTARRTRELEQAFEHMLNRARQGLEPDHFVLTASA